MQAAPPTRHCPRDPCRLRPMPLLLMAAGLASPLAHAGPDGGIVSAGQARISQSGGHTRIDQASQRAIIDWRGFDVGAAESVRFRQPGAGSATLNRVRRGGASRIDGQLSANGQVFIVNPAGVIFGQGASVNVSGLVATTSQIDNRDFMAGRLDFRGDGSAGEVRNEGTIQAADGGFVALVGPRVRNDGTIVARLGRVALGSGETFTIDLDGDQLVQFVLSEQDARALEQQGEIAADGGTVILLSADSARQVVSNVVNLGGVVRADTVEQREGRIILGAAGAGATVNGELLARGLASDSRGGSIDLRAGELSLDGATLDASGAAGGGTVHVGGAWQGHGDGPTAARVRVSADSRLAANATVAGDGGEVVVWADDHTRFDGHITARGGAAGGNGGSVEVSGKGQLDFRGNVDAGAPAGQAGHLLLDPLDITLGARDAGNISRMLRTGTTLQLQADRDITVNAAIDGRGGVDGGGLSLSAGRDIAINDFIVTANGAVSLLASTGSIRFASGKAIFAGSAPISLTAGGLLSSGALLTSGTTTLRSTGGAVHMDGVIDPANGDLVIDAADGVEINAPVLNLASGANVGISAGGDVSINAPINGFEAPVSGGTVRVEAGGSVAVNDFVVTSDGEIFFAAGADVRFDADAALLAGAAPIDITAANRLEAGATVTSGTVHLTSTGGDVVLGAAVQPGNGDLVVNAAGDVAVAAPVVNLLAGSDVDLRAGGNLDVDAEINGTGAPVAGGTVHLQAGDMLRLNDHVATADGAIHLEAGQTIEQSAEAIVSSGSADLEVISGGQLVTGILLSTGRITLDANAGIDVAGLISQTNGDLVVRSGGDVRILAPVANLRAGSNLDIDAGGDLIVSAQIDGLGATQAGEARLVADGDVLLDALVATRLAPIIVDAGGRLTLASGGGTYSEAGDITLQAGGPIIQRGTIQSPGDMDIRSRRSDVSLLAGLPAGGRVTVDAAGTLRVEAPLASPAGGQTLTLSANGDIVINAQIEGRGGAPGGGVVIDAGRLLTVNGAIATGSGSILIDAAASASFSGTATLFSGSGTIDVHSGGPLVSGPVSTAGSASLRSTGNSLTVDGPISAGNVTLQAATTVRINRNVVASGNLSVTGGSGITTSAPIQGGSVTLAGGAVYTGAPVVGGSSLSVSGDSVVGAGGLFSGGGLAVSATGSLATGNLSASSGLTVSSGGSLTVTAAIGNISGNVSYSAGGDLTLAAPVADLGGNVTLGAGGDVVIDERLDDIGGGVQISAGGDAHLNNHVVTVDAPINVSAGGTIVHLADGVDGFGAPQTVQLRAGTGSISETTGGTVSTGSMVTTGSVSVTSTGGDINVDVPIYETTGLTTLTAAGDININQVIANTTTGANLILDAGGDINIDAKVGPWDRSTGTTIGRNALPGGDITMTAVGSINIGADVATFRDTLSGDVARLSLTSTAGSIGFSAADIRVMSDSGTVAISAFNDFVNGPSLANVNATPTAGYYTTGHLSLASTGGDVTIASLIPNTTGSVEITAADAVQVNQRIYTDNGDITITAGAGGITQNPTADPNPDPFLSTGVVSDIDSGTGNLTLVAAGDINPTVLRTASTLTVKSTAGAINGGTIESSREVVTVLPLAINELGFPSQVNLAGFSGITNFNTKDADSIAAISTAGSITNLAFHFPQSVLLIAGVDINDPSTIYGGTVRMYAGRDILLDSIENASTIELRSGRHLSIGPVGDLGHVVVGSSAVMTAGMDPFATLAGTTIAGVSAPSWGGPAGPGNLSITNSGSIVWLAGSGGLTASATGDLTLPRLHVAGLSANDTSSPVTLSAGGNITVRQFETLGDVSVISTGGDITVNSTIGPHYAAPGPLDPDWNTLDLGVASLVMRADSGNIAMHEARAEGDITIQALAGQVAFLGGFNGVEAGGTRIVQDSDGVVVSNAIQLTNASRLPGPSLVSPVVAPGPTNVGPGAPAVPGAIPPVGPAGISVSMATGASVSASVGAPGASGVDGTTPGGVDGGVAGLGAAGGVESTQAPDGGDGFGEIFVAESDQVVAETRDPVRVETRQESDEPAAGADDEGTSETTGSASGSDPGGDDNEGGNQDGEPTRLAAGQPGDETAGEDKEDDEEDDAGTRAREDADQQFVVFAGGRGDARERDFGRGLPFEDGRVRP
ncbi:MAG: filamentous hemagglutinin N-terminal domain-containing protein [Rhodocyclaceae bacterium]|nr:filamentous hemagglutinin N-terminal domain-containing protein [Rhodocyclaceae bacterium]